MVWTQSPWVAWWISALALVAFGFAGCLYLFYTMKRETAQLQRRIRDDQAKFDEERRRLHAELQAHRNSLGGLQQALANSDASPAQPAAGLAGAPLAGRVSIDFHRRGQALRMHRRGETAAEIAATLQVPQDEVDLLLKAHSALEE